MTITIIDKSLPHHHLKSQETYTVLKGKLKLRLNKEVRALKAGESLIINPRKVHWAEGEETWVECALRPGWTEPDHLLE